MPSSKSKIKGLYSTGQAVLRFAFPVVTADCVQNFSELQRELHKMHVHYVLQVVSMALGNNIGKSSYQIRHLKLAWESPTEVEYGMKRTGPTNGLVGKKSILSGLWKISAWL